MIMNRICPAALCLILMVASGLLATRADGSSPDDPAAREFFEQKIRPLLAEHCHRCHGAEEQESGLRLDSRDAIMAGGSSGPAVNLDEPQRSVLMIAVRYQEDDLQMPPDGKLDDDQLADLSRWISLGVPYPDAASYRVAPRDQVDLEAGREHWSFQSPPKHVALPAVIDRQWPQSPIDYFILRRLEDAGLRPNAPAEPSAWLRRVTLDLTGLPPTPDQLHAFLEDTSPAARARVVDRLLASPAYGQRWGRHWLDVARYADSNGLDENIAHGNAWRYRDYVVNAMNRDMPFDQFLVEQLAGDLLPEAGSVERRHEQLVATGFLALGPKVLAEVDESKMEMDIVDEQVSTVGQAVLGLTIGCARCHDHKFDPLSTADYYGLAGIFKSTKTMESFTKIARWHENSLATADDLARLAAAEAQIDDRQKAIESLVKQTREKLAAGGCEPPEKDEAAFPDEVKQQLAELRQQLADLEAAKPVMPSAMGTTEGAAADAAIHIRGSHLMLGAVVPRRFPQVLAGLEQASLPPDQSGRLALARWLTTGDHPLTARVLVNRVWRWHFGAGLVRTPDNFGRLGEPPTHPELLDWLAADFTRHGWSLKRLHRTLVLSSTYAMSSHTSPEAKQGDPENRLWSRMPLRRLEAEAVRDALLVAADALDPAMGGSMLHVANREFFFNHTSEDKTTYDSQRRSLYLPIVRNHLYDVFQLFDYNDASVSNGNRATSVIAPQALFVMNSPLVERISQQLAGNARQREPDDPQQRVVWLYEKVFARTPQAAEVERVLQFIADASKQFVGDDAERQEKAWQAACQALLCANEFLYY